MSLGEKKKQKKERENERNKRERNREGKKEKNVDSKDTIDNSPLNTQQITTEKLNFKNKK